MKRLIVLGILLSVGSSFATNTQKLGPMPFEKTKSPKESNSTSGRYMYVGNAPKFAEKDLELTVSKMALTLRVKAWVTKDLRNGYRKLLINRVNKIEAALNSEKISLTPILDIDEYAIDKTDAEKAWLKVAKQYSDHVLAGQGQDIHKVARKSKEIDQSFYKSNILKATKSFLINNNDQNSSDENLSQRLFQNNLGHLYTEDGSRDGYEGYLTFVYSIAATAKGPFSKPNEKVTDLKLSSSIDSRWWSDKWQGEFGGFPFLLAEWNGIAFHGPISVQRSMNIWYVRRWYASHGCMRMDASDIMEFRTLLPTNFKKVGSGIKIKILNYFDVVDWNQNGTQNVMDVGYYYLPTSINTKNKTIEQAAANYMIENAQDRFWTNHMYAHKFDYDKTTRTFKNIPKYSDSRKVVKTIGKHVAVKPFTFAHRGNRIIQYQEKGAAKLGYNDSRGEFPPIFFQE